jgi:hypothetical protein
VSVTLLTFETRSFSFQAVGTDRDHAWQVLADLWERWCDRTGADPRLLDECRDDVHEMTLTPGGMFVDREPWGAQ